MKEQRYTLRIADLGRSCGFHDRGITLQAEFLSTSAAPELKLFNCVLFYRTKFVFLSPFYSHSLLDRLNYFLLISQVMLLADVAYQMYRTHHYLSGILSCALIIALSMWDEIRAIELLSRTIYKLPFLLYAAPRCLPTVAASQWPRELRFLKSCLNTGVAQVRKDSSQVRKSITVF